MSKRSVRAKIVLIAVSFSLPLAVLLYLTVVNINTGIDFAAKELAGTAYLRPLAEMLENVQEHELAKVSGSECAAVASRGDAALAELGLLNAKHGNLLEFNPEGLSKRKREHLTIPAVSAQWKAIRTAGCGAEPRQYEKLDADLRSMIVHAGDTSNLILDPDLDSYYLMDAVVIALPQTQSRQWKVVRESRTWTETQRKRAFVEAAMLKEADLDRIEGSIVTAINEDAGFYGPSPSLRAVLSPALDAYKVTAGGFAEMTENASAGESLEAFQGKGIAAMRASFGIWRSAVSELDVLLRARIAAAQSYRFWALVLAALALAGACALSWYFTRSIVVPLDALIRSLGPGATLLSECVGRIAESSKSTLPGSQEAEIICEELNAHADDMRHAVYQLALHVGGSGAGESAQNSEPVNSGQTHA